MKKTVRLLFALMAITALHGNLVMAKQTVAKEDQGKIEENKGAELPKPVVIVKVNGKEITSQDYASFLQRNQAYLKPAMETEQGKVDAWRALVGGVLIKEAMMRQKDLLPNGEKSGAKEVSEAYEKFAAVHFPIPPVPDEKTLFEYYQNHQNEYGLPEMVRISQIQFRFPDKANEVVKQQAKDRAEKALKRLESGEDFSQLATELTENPMGKYPKGDLGFLVRDQNPWLKNALNNLKVGDRTGILDSPVGYEILQLTDVRPAIITPFANVRDKVIQSIRDELQMKSRDAYIREIATGASIEVLQPEVKSLFPNGIFN